jgi:hypothetical protein
MITVAMVTAKHLMNFLDNKKGEFISSKEVL